MEMVKSRDAELVQLYLHTGARSHLEELTQRHLPRIRSMVYSMLLNHAQADDVTQEIFLKVYHSLATFEGKSKIYDLVVSHCRQFGAFPSGPATALAGFISDECSRTGCKHC